MRISSTTYIQSGNVIFESEETITENIEEALTKTIKVKYGFDVPVIVRTLDYFKDVVRTNPFFNKNEDLKSFHITFLSKKPSKIDVDAFNELSFGKDKFQIIDKAVHIFVTVPYHKSKLTNQIIEKKLNCKATTRNWKTVNKLIELATI